MMFAPPSLSEHAQQERTKRSTSTIKKTDGSSSPLADQSKLHFITPTEVNVCSFHQSLKRTTKRPGLEQLGDRGREAIGADPELTEDHEEDTEGHPRVGELDLIFGGHTPGEVRKTHHVSAHAPFPEMAATSCGMPVDISKLLIHQPTQLLKAFLCDTAVSLGMRPSLIDRLSSTAALFL